MSAPEPSAPEAVRGEDAVRAALLDAAADLLGDVGPSSVSVREIARRAGVNHGQVHHYFGSKRGLLRAAMRKLAQEHFANATRLAGGGVIPPPLALAGDPRYWRAVCHVVMDGDLELARIEIDEDVSVPRRALLAIQAAHGAADDDLALKARFAALTALQLGWVAFEEFVFLLADVRGREREALRERVKSFIEELTEREGAWTSD